MALTRLDNLISSKTGKYLYVSPDDFNASDELNNRGNSPIRPFKSIQRAFLEVARYSYLPGPDNDRFDQFTIMLMPGNHYIDNRPGLVDTNSIPEFGFNQAMNEWTDNSNLDISDPNNILYLFNNTEGGAILPRGSSLVGYDLRRTIVRPLYVPDPADKLEKRSAIFNVTGGCYFWQFTIKDGDLEPSSPLYDTSEGVGKVYYQNGQWDQLAIPNYSHHKLTVFEYADAEELGIYYRKIAKAFSQYQPTIDDPGELTPRIQETRIVGPLSDLRSIESIKCTDSSPVGTITVEVTTKVNHGYFKNQFIAIENNGLDDQLNGTFPVFTIDPVDGRKFSYQIAGTVAALGTVSNLVSGTVYTAQNGLSANAVVKAEVDSVESASPYVFNCSIRSTWGICGIWANGLKATGFKSMVIAQYTGVSLQKDDRAFIRYDEFTNTWNEASLTDAFATVPYHTKGDAYWKDDWRNFHVRATEDAFIQNVSIFAVGFADHFLMESGGDMSITNSNSNFGNTSLHAIGFKGFAFSQDKGGYITDIVPPQIVPETTGNTKKNAYYTLDVKASNDPNNHTKIYFGDDEGYDPTSRPAASINGFRLGARSDEKLYVKLTPRSAGSGNIFNATVTPNGFQKYTASAEILNPSGVTINNRNLDAANRIEDNKLFIQEEAYGYITGKFPNLLIRANIDINKCKRDIGYLIDATVQDLRLGGNINTIQAAEAYYVGNNLSYINAELNESLEAYAYTRDLAIAAMRNFDYLRTGAATTSGSSIVDIGDTTGIVQGMTVLDYDPSQFVDGKLISGATRPASPVIPDGTYVKRVINATDIELGQKAVYSEKKIVADRFADARNLILANQNFIAQEAYERMLLDFPGFTVPTGNPQDCTDDINDVIAQIAENVAYGGNAETWDAAYIYESGAHVAGEEAQTIRAFEYARDMCIQVMRNEDVFVFGSHGLTQSKDTSVTYEAPTPVADRNADARNLILSNKNLIAQEAYARMLVEYPGFVVPTGNPQDCIDDIVDVLEAVADNVAYGGNDKTYDAASVYVKGAHVAGEEAETVYAFNQAKEMAIQAMRNQQIIVLGSHGLTQTYDNTVTAEVADSVIDRAGDARDLILANQNLIAHEAYARMSAQNPGFLPPTGDPQDCIDDILGIVENVAWNVAFGGNDRVWDCANVYVTGAYVAGEEAQTIEAFDFARDLMIQAMRNETIVVSGPHGYTQTKDLTITVDPSSPVCADIASTITSLTAVITNAITTPASLAGVSRTLSLGPCNDVRTTIITLFDIINNAIITPSSLSAIQRNLSNGSCQNVASTITTLWDIILTTLANPGYLQSIERVESPLGLAFGPSVNANATTSNAYLYFDLSAGVYSNTTPTVDDTITQAPEYPECNDVATTIRQYFDNIGTILQTGLNSVPRSEPTQLTTELASRATVWTLQTGSGSNPHNLETGTPVRLVPRPRYDVTTNQYVDVDKRKVRLPNGFETNEKYYVIAPGRTTTPEDYSTTTVFNGSDQTKIMLASSKENAAAGIYIHSAEVEAIDPDIEIDIYQFVLDDNYDLHEYSCVLDSGQGAVNSGIRTDVPHIFDVPFADITGHQIFFRENEGGSRPLVGSAYALDPSVADGNGRIRGDKFFWARYQNKKVFTVHTSKSDAIANINPITWQPGTYDFSVFADKRRSPVRYDPTYANPDTAPVIYGKWYMQVEDHSSNANDPEYEYNILTRFHETAYSDLSGQNKTNDSWFERIKDEREAEERIYRLRYVIPQYLQSVRDPINGFSIKMRKDETRKLLPQKLLLKPVSGSVTKASFYNPVQPSEKIGFGATEFADVNLGLSADLAYDPYKKDIVGTTQYAKVIETSNYVSMTIQSGRYVTVNTDEYLELTVFDVGITNLGLLNENFVTVQITAPQGGNFVADKTQSLDAVNRIDWFGNSSGYAYIHAVMNVPGTSDWYMILKGVSGKIDYSQFTNTRFSQGAVFADLLGDEDFGKSLYIKDLIAKGYPEYYYRQNGAKVYTVTPGDIITDDANIQYYVASVEDTGEIEDTFYIFDVEEIQRRIYGQQDGIYYLTAVRGNISPYPTGAGSKENFRNFKFSQPISKLYPLNYKNDPLWFKQLDATEVDPPATFSAADNYTHGLVRVNDFKGSMTKEMVGDFISQPALSDNTYTQVSSTVDNRIRAQKGNASAGSEDRLIPIAGDSTVVTDQRLYVELRRPSIARAGNHTFEYLGFGPGNYSTGLPARQEIVLTPTQDFYAQSKKQDGGLVFYTGLNSNGDLYIGNRKIDAITGEEEFLESASLVDSEDDVEDIGNLVTTFDTPVTFNEYITVNGGDAQDRPSTFNSPVVINVLGRVRDYALQVISNVSPSDGDDPTLDKTAQFLNQDTAGDIVIARNRVAASIFQFNPRGSNGAAQGYKIQNHAVANIGSNITPNQSGLYGAVTGGTALDSSQNVLYGSNVPLSGDILLKGSEVGQTGSLGWIYANFYENVPNANIANLSMNGSTVITINWSNNLSNEQIGLTSGSQIRISNFSDGAFNGLWQIITSTFSPASTSCQIAILENRGNVDNDNPRLWSTEVALGSGVLMEFSSSSWKEVGVLGAEAIRTDTDTIGDYRLGINTVARSEHSAYTNGFVDVNTDPRANLDVVGTAFISGKTISDYLDHSVLANRTEVAQNNAFLVGGDSATPNNEATLRVATTNNGRVGINVTNAELDRALVVDGESRFTGDARFQQDIEVHGGGGTNTAEIRTDITSGIFNLVDDTTFTGTLNIGSQVGTLNVVNDRTDDQFIYVGNSSDHSNIWIGNTPDTNTNISKVTIGGAYNNNESLSFTQIDTKSFKTSGDFQLGTKRGFSDTVRLSSTAGTVEFFSGNSATANLDFATNASQITIGGQGGETRVRNNLVVDSKLRVNSDIILCGGFASYSFTAFRAQMGSTAFEHATGILGNNLFNSNVDIVDVLRVLPSSDVYNELDTAGSGEWGSTDYQEVITQIPGTVEPTELPALTGKQYYLPLKYSPYDQNGVQYLNENDIILLDTPVTGSKHPEFLRIVSLPRISTAPYYIVVERQPFGTFTAIRSDHTDNSAIYKCIVQFDATWTTTLIDGTGGPTEQENVYLSEFGGSIDTGDYLIIDRGDGTPSGDGIDDAGEVFKLNTVLDQVAKVFSIRNGCDTASEEVVFEIDSTNGNTTINSDTTTISGTLNLNGVCGGSTGIYPSPDTSLDNHLTISNPDGPVWDVNMCNGDMRVGSLIGTVFGVGQYWGTSGLAHSEGTATIYGYRFRKETLNALTGPISQVTVGFTVDDWNIPIDDLTGFSKGDLVLIYNGSTQGEIILVTDDPYISNNQAYLPTIYNAEYLASVYPNGGRGAEQTGKQNWQAGAIVVKLYKYGYTTTLADPIPAAGSRTAVESPNTNANKIRVKMADSRIVANKLDTSHFFRIVSGNTVDSNGKNTSQEWFWADSIDSNNSSYGVRIAKGTQSAAQAVTGEITHFFGGGSTTIYDEVNIYGGEFRIWGSDGETLLFNLSNDDDHAADGAVLDPKTGKNGLWIKGNGTFLGNLIVQTDTCEANGACSNDTVFEAFNDTGSLNMGEQLYIKGKVVPTDTGDADVAILHIDNLGGAGTGGTVGPRDFKIYQDGSIDSFGISRYFTRNGGRRYTYVEQSLTGVGQTQTNPLQPNNNYLLNNPSGTNMVLYLPDYAETGDMIRFVEVSGNLTYNTSLVLRALKINNQATAIQGDTSGSKIQAGSGQLTTAWDSGELIVQTRNASFGLIYVGPTDAAGDPNASSIPSNLRGWWLTEL